MLIGLWCGVGVKERASHKHMFNRDWTFYSNVDGYSSLSSEHSWGRGGGGGYVLN